MALDVIPAGESGSFKVTDEMVMNSDAVTMAAFEVLLRAEAERRQLDLSVEPIVETQDVIVRWRPARSTQSR